MPAKRVAQAGLIPLQFEKLTCSNSTAQTLNSTSQGASVLHLSVETQDVRYRFDSTAATLTTGVLLQADTAYEWQGLDGGSLSNLTFQRSTGTTVVNLMAYRYTGSGSS